MQENLTRGRANRVCKDFVNNKIIKCLVKGTLNTNVGVTDRRP